MRQDPHPAPRYPRSETIYVYPVEGFILPRIMEIEAVRTHEVPPSAKGGQTIRQPTNIATVTDNLRGIVYSGKPIWPSIENVPVATGAPVSG